MFWSKVFFLIKLKYWFSYFNLWTRKVKRKLENSVWRGSQAHQRKDHTKRFLRALHCNRQPLDCVLHVALRRCPNQQNFDFDVENGGISKGEWLIQCACMLASYFFFLEYSIKQNTLQILWDVMKAILLHPQMYCWCSRTSKSEER